MKLTIETASLPLEVPFVITGRVEESAELIRINVAEGGHSGCGEAAGVDYFDETPASMARQLEGVRDEIENGCDLERLQTLLPPGGARNAVDCALWDLKAKTENKTIWQLTGLSPSETITVYSIGIGAPEEMAEKAAKAASFPNIKVKLDNNDPIARISAIRAARPDANLVVDINQGWTFAELKDYAPEMARLGVKMIEQPLPRGEDEALSGYRAPLPVCADESCQSLAELDKVAKWYDMINVKLDKAGGLTEALKLRVALKERGLGMMVGCMVGSSLSMAPAFVVAQGCDLVDIDGPLLLRKDAVDHPMIYKDRGRVEPPTPALWG